MMREPIRGSNRLVNVLKCEPIRVSNRLMTYNWQQPDWPDFRYDLGAVEAELLHFSEHAGRVGGLLHGLTEVDQNDAFVELMIAEAMKSSAIEGEALSRPDVKSSIRFRLGLDASAPASVDEPSAGAAELMVQVRNEWDQPLDREMMFNWHRALMRGNPRVKVGGWRTHEEPMQVISGAVGKEKLHFEAPPSAQVPDQMAAFVHWFNQSANQLPAAPVRAALAHLYFESIHPFEDGNGRLGRAVAEKALSQGLGRPATISLSRTIEANRTRYYDALEHAQRSNEVTNWINYFVPVVVAAQRDAVDLVKFILDQAKLFDRLREQLSERQTKVLRRMLADGPGGFKGGMNARKYVSLTKTSKATATRDLQRLAKLGALVPVGAGRSSRYEVNL
ncbi:MAG: Fic family protein [Synoicihabitans sp.]